MILKIYFFIIISMVMYASLCFTCGFRDKYVRAENENHCLFYENNKCTFILWKWFFPCWLYRKINKAGLFCPFCYDTDFHNDKNVTKETVGLFWHRLGYLLLAIGGSGGIIIFIFNGR